MMESQHVRMPEKKVRSRVLNDVIQGLSSHPSKSSISHFQDWVSSSGSFGMGASHSSSDTHTSVWSLMCNFPVVHSLLSPNNHLVGPANSAVRQGNSI